MPNLRILFRGIRTARVMDSEPRTADAAKTAADTDPADDAMYLRDPHNMLRMDAATAEAYVAAMSA
jgi:hypothetical protein